MSHIMMQQLRIEEGGFITVKSATLQKGTFVKVQPQSTTFLDISNPKAVLENRLRNFSCLTQGDVIKIEYNSKNYFLNVIEVKPGTSVSIVETDLFIDFAPPLDYVEKKVEEPPVKSAQASAAININKNKMEEDSPSPSPKSLENNFKPFVGTGYSLKSATPKSTTNMNTNSPIFSKSPATTLSKSPATAKPSPKPTNNKKEEEQYSEDEDSDEEEKKAQFKAFSGTGYKLKG